MTQQSSAARAAFDARLAELNTRLAVHERELLRFLHASPFGAPLLARELARRGISRDAFNASITIPIKAETIPANH